MERVAALKYIFESLDVSPVGLRLHPTSLALGAIAIYMLNALLYRQGDREGDQELADACAMWIDSGENMEYSDSEAEDDEYCQMVPIREDQGLYFVADIMDNDRHQRTTHYRLPAPRMKSKALQQIIGYKYDVNELADLEGKLGLLNLAIPSARIHPTRLNNRAPVTASVTDFGDAPPRIDFGFEERGMTLNPNIGVYGDDVESDEESEEEGEDELTRKVTNLWFQMFVDILWLAPNRRNSTSPSYCSMPKQLRQNAKPELFEGYELPFHEIHYKVATRDEWHNIFDHFFPNKTDKPRTRKIQNFPMAKYWNTYISLINRMDSGSDIIYLRKKLRIMFDKLTWMPAANADRMWDSSTLR